MSEEPSQDMNGNRSFEERVFARFDVMDSSFRDLDARLQKLEAKSYDTKPIWERALAEILAVSQKLDTVERKLNVLSQDMLALRADQIRLEDQWIRLNLNQCSNYSRRKKLLVAMAPSTVTVTTHSSRSLDSI